MTKTREEKIEALVEFEIQHRLDGQSDLVNVFRCGFIGYEERDNDEIDYLYHELIEKLEVAA